MATSPVQIIDSEETAWQLFESLVNDPEMLHDVETIRVSGWNPRLLYFPDEALGHTLRPSAAKSLDEFHRNIMRAYALLVYGQADLRVMSASERDSFNIPFHIIAGSSGVEIPEKILDKIFNDIWKTLSRTQKRAVALGVLLLCIGSFGAKLWLDKHYNQKLAEIEAHERIEMSKQETERTRLLIDAFRKNGVHEGIREETDKCVRALVKVAAHSEENNVRVLGVEISRAQAKRALAPPEMPGEGSSLSGEFYVILIDMEAPDGYALRLEHVDTGCSFRAVVSRVEVAEADIRTIFDAARKKSTFYGTVNTFEVDGEIKKAFVVRVQDSLPDPLELLDGLQN